MKTPVLKTPVLKTPVLKIHIKDIKKAFKILMDLAEGKLSSEPDLPYTLFWVTNFKEGLDLANPKTTVADLRDDIEHTLLSLSPKTRTSTVLDFEKLGNIIKALGHEVYK